MIFTNIKNAKDLVQQAKAPKLASLKTDATNTIYAGTTFKDSNGDSHTITLTQQDQMNNNSSAVAAMNIISTVTEGWKASTEVADHEMILQDGVYYIALAGGTTGNTMPTFPTEFSTAVDDNGVQWYKLGMLVGTDTEPINFSIQDIVSIYHTSAMYIDSVRTKYKDLAKQVNACTTKADIDKIVWS